MPLPLENHYTLADALTWEEGERIELIYGDPVMMAPAPIRIHQEISGKLFGQLRDYLKGKNAEYITPLFPSVPLSATRIPRRTWTHWCNRTSP